jgi:hypothetical protein
MGASMGALQVVTIILRLLLQSSAALAAESLALRHQEAVLQCSVKRPRLHRRDRIYGSHFGNRVRGMGIEEVLIAPRSSWQNPFIEHLTGSTRREILELSIQQSPTTGGTVDPLCALRNAASRSGGCDRARLPPVGAPGRIFPRNSP